MIPAVLFLGVIFWILMSGIKYWYFSKMNIIYTHKLDEKILEEIRRPPKEVLERVNMKKHAREVGADVGPEGNCSSKNDSKFKEGNDPEQVTRGKKQDKGRSPTIFEEMDLLKKNGTKLQPNPSKYNRDVFDDPLSRLYQDIQKLKRESNA